MSKFGNFKTKIDWDVEQRYVVVGGQILSQAQIDAGELPQNTNGDEIQSYKAIVHSGTKKVLHVCKVSYVPTTNGQFMNFVQELSNLTGYPIEGYTEFNEGEIVLAYLKEESSDLFGYETENYIVVGNSHNGTKPLFIGHCNQMLRCTNQFGTITKESSVYHTKSQEAKMNVVLGAYEKYKEQKAQFQANMEKLNSILLTDDEVRELTSRLLNLEEKNRSKNGELHGRTLGIVESINESVRKEINDLGQTLFGWFNGITYYTSNVKKVKSPIFGNLFGSNKTMNDDALEIALQFYKEKTTI